MCNCIRQRLGWALAIITIWGTSNAAWGQESQTPPAATGQYAARRRPNKEAINCHTMTSERDLNSKSGRYIGFRTYWRVGSKVRLQLRPATQIRPRLHRSPRRRPARLLLAR